MTKKELLSSVLYNAVVAILYFLTGKLDFALFQQDMIVTLTVFIPEGIALAAVLIYGYRVLPGIFLGQLLLAIFSNLSFFPAFSISLINTFEAAIALKLFSYFKLDKMLVRFRDLIGLFLLILLVLQPFSALLGNSVLFLFNAAKESSFLSNLFYWWFGNVMGQLLVTPMLLIIYFSSKKIHYLRYLMVALLFTLLNYILQIVLGVHNISLMLLVTLSITIYLATVNLPYATVATFSTVGSSLFFLHLHQGAFAFESNNIDQILDVNFFILSNIVIVLIIGVLFREKELANKSLHAMAHYDTLTGLPNRNILDDEINMIVYLYERYAQKSAICFIDLDGFKAVNDTYGHDVGDKLLQEVAKQISKTIRLTDTLLRLGGDEFLLILKDVDKKITQDLLKRVMQSIHDINKIDNHTINISLSVGVAGCPVNGTTVDELVNAADEAMYKVKNGGKDNIVFTQNFSMTSREQRG